MLDVRPLFLGTRTVRAAPWNSWEILEHSIISSFVATRSPSGGASARILPESRKHDRSLAPVTYGITHLWPFLQGYRAFTRAYRQGSRRNGMEESTLCGRY